MPTILNHWSVLSLLFVLLFIVGIVVGYIDIPLKVHNEGAEIAFNVPMMISNIQYSISVSLENKEQVFHSVKSKKTKSKSKSKSKSKKLDLTATIKVSSLQGYTFEGWRRFFLEVFYISEQMFQHADTQIHESDKFIPLTDGVMTFGPQLSQNYMYQLIKQQMNDFIVEDVISIYVANNRKDARMQLGGYEVTNARGHGNGVLFYVMPVTVSSDEKHWLLEVARIACSRQRNSHWETFFIPQSNIKLKLSLQSQYVILPLSFKQQVEQYFETENIDCAITTQLECKNMTTIDQALSFLSFQMNENIFINISLYDLRDSFNDKQKLTTFFIRFGAEDQLQLGSALLRNYYISLNMNSHTLMFSPLNRFPPDVTSVGILRFLFGFLVFMIVSCIIVSIWVQVSDPTRRRRKRVKGKEGVRLVSYQRANEDDDQE